MPHVVLYAFWLRHPQQLQKPDGRVGQLSETNQTTLFTPNDGYPGTKYILRGSGMCRPSVRDLIWHVPAACTHTGVTSTSNLWEMPRLWACLLLFSAVGALRQPLIGTRHRRPRARWAPPHPSPPPLSCPRRAHEKGSTTAEIDVPKAGKAAIKIKPAKFHNLR